VPYSDQPPGSDAPDQANTANFYKNDDLANGYDDGWAVTGSTGQVPTQNYLTDVGAYMLSDSFYGTFDQGGNVYEWNEALIDGSSRLLRGGVWNGGSVLLAASGRLHYYDPSFENAINVGFRVASIPEPGSLVMLLGIALTALLYGWRRRG
jgi:formylglycine-generating enzyme required for sulfatase activity